MRFVVDVNAVQATAAALAAVVSLVYILGRIPFLWGHLKLANMYSRVQGENAYLRGAQAASLSAAEGWKSAVEQLTKQVQELKTDVQQLRHLHIVSAKYIADLIQHIKNPRLDVSMPPIPLELEEDVRRHLDEVR